jgi:hypothetical protein
MVFSLAVKIFIPEIIITSDIVDLEFKSRLNLRLHPLKNTQKVKDSAG